MSAQSSLSAGLFRSELDAERSICSDRRLAVARVPSSRPGATQLTSVSGASATAMYIVVTATLLTFANVFLGLAKVLNVEHPR